MNKTNKQKMPVGMILILILIGWGAVSLLIALRNPVSQLGPILLTGVEAATINLIIFAILGVIFFGIIKRFILARKLAIGWYIISMVLSLINLLSFMANKTMYNEYYNKILAPEMAALMTSSVITISLIMTLVFGWIIGIIIIVYLLKKKDFFTN
jgi:hypothetical protein